jgi:hypothetical protein
MVISFTVESIAGDVLSSVELSFEIEFIHCCGSFSSKLSEWLEMFLRVWSPRVFSSMLSLDIEVIHLCGSFLPS